MKKEILFLISGLLAATVATAYVLPRNQVQNQNQTQVQQQQPTQVAPSPFNQMVNPQGPYGQAQNQSMIAPTRGPKSTFNCKAVEAICISQGFKLLGSSGDDLLNDCVLPLLSGQTVPNINLPPSQLAGCKISTPPSTANMPATSTPMEAAPQTPMRNADPGD